MDTCFFLLFSFLFLFFFPSFSPIPFPSSSPTLCVQVDMLYCTPHVKHACLLPTAPPRPFEGTLRPYCLGCSFVFLLLKKTAPTRLQRTWQAHHQPTSGKAAGKAGSRPGHWSTALAQPQSFTVTVRPSHQSKPRQAKSYCSSRRAASSTGSRRFVAGFPWCSRSLAAGGMVLPIQQPSRAMGLRKYMKDLLIQKY